MTARILTVKEVKLRRAAQLCGSASSCSSDLLLILAPLFIFFCARQLMTINPSPRTPFVAGGGREGGGRRRSFECKCVTL